MRRAEIRTKILLLGKLCKMYGDVQADRMTAVRLRGLTKRDGTVPAVAPELLRAATDGHLSNLLGKFHDVKMMDRENEKRPPMRRRASHS